jgi:hypothetical protein
LTRSTLNPIVLNRPDDYPGGITSQQGGGLAGRHRASEILLLADSEPRRIPSAVEFASTVSTLDTIVLDPALKIQRVTAPFGLVCALLSSQA